MGLGPLPDGWRWVRLGDVCRLVNGDAYKESDWTLHGIPIIRIQNLNDPNKPFNHWAGDLDGRVVIHSGDVLLAWSGTPGTSFGAHLWNRGRGVLNQHIFRIDLDRSCINPQWAVFAINNRLDVMIGKAHGGVGLRHVTKSEVESLTIPLPPLSEQQRIAAILNEQMAAVEKARAAAEAQLKAAKALPAAYLCAVFNNPEARRWPRQRFGDVCELLPAKSIATDGDTSVLAITTACLSETGFQPSGIKPARMWASDAAECGVSPGEVLIARSNTPELVGRVAMFSGDPKGAVASDLTIRIRPRDDLEPPFLTAYLSFLYLSGYWKDRAGGASGSMKKITRTQILNEKVPVPPLSEQKRISNHLSKRMASADRTRKALEEQLDTINKLPASLLRRAFSGEI
ncbi:MAG: restriction endonuclease subunit S [Candidatus Binatia bacterium]